MKLSTKGRYGVRLMLDLASYSKNSPVALKDISLRENISQKYLWQLINLLKKAGLIISTRGARAGYTLAKRPSEINLNDIVSVLEGNICLAECIDVPSACKLSDNCVSRIVWRQASYKVRDVLASFTLEKMLKMQSAKLKAAGV